MARHIMTRHHIVPKERVKHKSFKANQASLHLGATVKLWQEKHEAWHVLFKNMTIPEIIECLQRLNWIVLRKAAKQSRVIPMNYPLPRA